MTGPEIIAQLPYSEPFLFVDEILSMNDEELVGCFRFHPDLDFYRGHFKDFPITPGVILTECMAQIGLACFGIYLMKGKWHSDLNFAFTKSEVEFLAPVFPDETVFVRAKKIFFRFGKLKCEVEMSDSNQKPVCRGILSGMLIPNQ